MLRKLLLASAASAALATSAMAADLPVAVPAAIPAPSVVFNWTGFYAGINVGYAWGDTRTREVGPAGYNGIGNNWSYTADGFMGGIQLGYNVQFSGLIVGLQGDLGYLGVSGGRADPLSLGLDTRASTTDGLYVSLTGRLGFAANNFMVYARGGYIWADIGHSVVDNCNVAPCGPALVNVSTSGRSGWTLGGGVEVAINPNLSVFAEYMYADFGNVTTLSAAGFGWTHDLDVHTARIGLNFRFGAPPAAVPARF